MTRNTQKFQLLPGILLTAFTLLFASAAYLKTATIRSFPAEIVADKIVMSDTSPTHWLKAFKAAKQTGLVAESDTKLLIHYLAILAEREPELAVQFPLVFDIGANGIENFDHHISCVDAAKDFTVVAFEPMPTAFEAIEKLSNLSNYDAFPFAAFKTAGIINSSGSAGDEQASLDKDASSFLAKEVERNQAVITVDDILANGINAAIPAVGNPNAIAALRKKSRVPKSIYLLKIATAGNDMFVLDGTLRSLSEKRVKFLSFEYNRKWSTSQHARTLKEASVLLEKHGYSCYWITRTVLIPISGKFWFDEYEWRDRSNLFCGQTEDKDLKWVVDMYNLQIMN